MHLLRPDEAIPVEAVRRGLQLDDHLSHMVIWGYFDWKTGENIVPSLEEMYIEDEDEVLANVDTLEHWKPKHVLKKRWEELTPQQQDEILSDEEDERLRAQAWCGTLDEDDDAGSLDDSDSDSDESLDLDEEINRGYIVPPQPKDHESTVPGVHDTQGWVNFVNQTLLGGMVPDLGGDERLRAEAWNSHPEPEPEPQIDNEQLLDAFLAELRSRHRQQQWAAASLPQEEDGDGGEEESQDDEMEDEEDDEGDVEDNDDIDGNDNDLQRIYQGFQFQLQPPSDTQLPYYYYPFDDAQMDLDLQSFMPTSSASDLLEDPVGLNDGQDEIMQDEDEGQGYGDVF